VDAIAGMFIDQFPVAEGTFVTCIKTTEAFSQPIEDSFRLDLVAEDYWE
jgi:hypothetical protein